MLFCYNVNDSLSIILYYYLYSFNLIQDITWAVLFRGQYLNRCPLP